MVDYHEKLAVWVSYMGHLVCKIIDVNGKAASLGINLRKTPQEKKYNWYINHKSDNAQEEININRLLWYELGDKYYKDIAVDGKMIIKEKDKNDGEYKKYYVCGACHGAVCYLRGLVGILMNAPSWLKFQNKMIQKLKEYDIKGGIRMSNNNDKNKKLVKILNEIGNNLILKMKQQVSLTVKGDNQLMKDVQGADILLNKLMTKNYVSRQLIKTGLVLVKQARVKQTSRNMQKKHKIAEKKPRSHYDEDGNPIQSFITAEETEIIKKVMLNEVNVDDVIKFKKYKDEKEKEVIVTPDLINSLNLDSNLKTPEKKKADVDVINLISSSLSDLTIKNRVISVFDRQPKKQPKLDPLTSEFNISYFENIPDVNPRNILQQNLRGSIMKTNIKMKIDKKPAQKIGKSKTEKKILSKKFLKKKN